MQVWAIVRSRTGEKDDTQINNQLNKIRGFAYENGDMLESFIDVFKFTTIEVIKRIVNSGVSRVYIADISHLSPNFDSQVAFLASCNALKIEVISANGKELHFESQVEDLVRTRLLKPDEHSRNRREIRKRVKALGSK